MATRSGHRWGPPRTHAICAMSAADVDEKVLFLAVAGSRKNEAVVFGVNPEVGVLPAERVDGGRRHVQPELLHLTSLSPGHMRLHTADVRGVLLDVDLLWEDDSPMLVFGKVPADVADADDDAARTRTVTDRGKI